MKPFNWNYKSANMLAQSHVSDEKLEQFCKSCGIENPLDRPVRKSGSADVAIREEIEAHFSRNPGLLNNIFV